MEYRSPLDLGVIAIEKGTIGSISSKVTKFTLLICLVNIKYTITNTNTHSSV